MVRGDLKESVRLFSYADPTSDSMGSYYNLELYP